MKKTLSSLVRKAPHAAPWLQQQSKAFGNWVCSIGVLGNQADLLESMKEGALLPALTAALLGVAEVPGVTRNPVFKPQKMGNINKCIIALRAAGCDVSDVNAGALYDGEPADVLAFVWKLIAHFEVRGDAAVHRARLVAWMRSALQAEGIRTELTNELGSSLSSGIVLCALANNVLRGQGRADLTIDLAALSASNVQSNCNVAMVLLAEAGVPRILAPDDVAEGADERALMLLLTIIYRTATAEEVTSLVSPGRRDTPTPRKDVRLVAPVTFPSSSSSSEHTPHSALAVPIAAPVDPIRTHRQELLLTHTQKAQRALQDIMGTVRDDSLVQLLGKPLAPAPSVQVARSMAPAPSGNPSCAQCPNLVAALGAQTAIVQRAEALDDELATVRAGHVDLLKRLAIVLQRSNDERARMQGLMGRLEQENADLQRELESASASKAPLATLSSSSSELNAARRREAGLEQELRQQQLIIERLTALTESKGPRQTVEERVLPAGNVTVQYLSREHTRAAAPVAAITTSHDSSRLEVELREAKREAAALRVSIASKEERVRDLEAQLRRAEASRANVQPSDRVMHLPPADVSVQYFGTDRGQVSAAEQRLQEELRDLRRELASLRLTVAARDERVRQLEDELLRTTDTSTQREARLHEELREVRHELAIVRASSTSKDERLAALEAQLRNGSAAPTTPESATRGRAGSVSSTRSRSGSVAGETPELRAARLEMARMKEEWNLAKQTTPAPAASDEELRGARDEILRLRQSLRESGSEVVLPTPSINVTHIGGGDKSAAGRIAELERKLADARTTQQRANQVIEDLSKRLQAGAETERHLSEQLSDARAAAKRADVIIIELNARLAEAQQQASQRRSQSRIEAELHARLLEVTRECNETKELLEEAHAVNRKADSVIAELSGRLAMAQEESRTRDQALRQQLAAAQHTVEELERRLAQTSRDEAERVAELERQLREAQQSREASERRLEESRNANRQTDTAIAQLDRQLKEALSESEQRSVSASSSAEVVRLREQIASLEKQLAAAVAARDAAQGSLDGLNARVAELAAASSKSNMQLRERDVHIAHVTADLDKAHKQLHDRDATIVEQEARLSHAASEASKASKHLRERDSTIETLQARIAQLASDTEAQHAKLTEKLRTLKSRLDDEEKRRVLAEKLLAARKAEDSDDDEGAEVVDLDDSSVEAVLAREAQLRERRRIKRQEREEALRRESIMRTPPPKPTHDAAAHARIEELEASVRALQATLDDERDEYETSAKEQQQQIDELREKLKSASASADDLEEAQALLQAQETMLAELNATLGETEERLLSVEVLESKLASAERELAAERAQWADERQRLLADQERSRQVAAAPVVDDERVRELTRELERVRAELEQQRIQWEEDRDSLEENRDALEDERDSLQEKVAELEAQLADAASSAGNAEREQALAEQLERAQHEVNDLVEQAARAELQSASRQRDALTALQQQLDASRASLVRAERDRDDATTILERERNEWRVERDELMASRQRTVGADSGSGDGAMDDALEELREQLNDAQRGAYKADERMRELTARLETEKARADALQEELNGASEEVDSLRDELSAALASVESARSSLRSQQPSASTIVNVDQEELERARRDRAIAMKVKDKVMLENADLHSKLTTMRRESMVRTSVDESEALRLQLLQKEGELTTLQREYERLQEEQQQNSESSRSVVDDSVVEQLRESVDGLQEQLAEAREERDAATQRLEAAVREREEHAARSVAAHGRLEALERQSARMGDATAQLEALEKQLHERETEVDTLERQRKKSAAQAVDLQRQLDDATGEVEALERQRKQSAMKQGALEEQLHSATTRIEALERQLRSVQDRAAELETDLSDAMEAVASREQRLAEFRERMAELDELQEMRRERQLLTVRSTQLTDEVRQLEEALATQRATARTQQQESNERHAEATRDAAAARQKAEHNARQVATMEKDLDAANRRVAELKGELADVVRDKNKADARVAELSREVEASDAEVRAAKEAATVAADKLRARDVDVADKEAELRAKVEAMRELQSACDDATAKVAAMQKQHIAMERDNNNYRERYTEMHNQLDATRAQMVETRSAASKQEAELLSAKTALAEATADGEAGRRKIKELETRCHALEDALREANQLATDSAALAKQAQITARAAEAEAERQTQQAAETQDRFAALNAKLEEESKRRQLMREQIEQEREKFDRAQREFDSVRKAHEAALADASRAEATREVKLANSALEEAKRTEQLVVAQQKLDAATRELVSLRDVAARAHGWEDREAKWREAVQLLGERENAARRALSASEEVYRRRQTDYESELRRNRTLTADLAALRVSLDEKSALLAAATAGNSDNSELARRAQVITQLEAVIVAQRREIAALEGRLVPEEGSALACGDDGAAFEQSVSESTRNVFLAEARLLQTRLSHETAWRQAVASEVRTLQRIMVAMHSLLQRQSLLLHSHRESKNAIESDVRKAVTVPSARREHAHKLAETRRAHGPSAAKSLLLKDIMVQVEAMEVLSDDKGASERSVTAALEAYLMADRTAHKNLRRRYREFAKETAAHAMPFNVQSVVAPVSVSDASYATLAQAMGEFVARHSGDAREPAFDSRLFAVLDQVVPAEARRRSKAASSSLSASGGDGGNATYQHMVESELLLQCFERFVGESGHPLEAFTVLNRCLEEWSEERLHGIE